MNIRRAVIEDHKELSRLFNAYRIFYKQPSDIVNATTFILERLKEKDSVVFMCLDEHGEGMGFVQLYTSFTSVGMSKIWLLNDLYVDENHRRKGIALALMNKAKSFCAETGRPKIVLETGIDNIQAQKLYNQLGYVKENNLTYVLNV